MFKGLFKTHPKAGVALGALLTGAVLFFTFSDDYVKTFKDNLVPELVGVAVDLALIVFVLDIIALKQEKKRSRQLEKRAREYLRFIVVNMLKNDELFEITKSALPSIVDYDANKHDFKFFASERLRSNEVIDALIVALSRENTTVNDHIKKHVETELSSFHSLFPIVAEVSDEHFKIWGRIVYFLTKVSHGEDLASNMITVLQKIKKFDRHTERVFGKVS